MGEPVGAMRVIAGEFKGRRLVTPRGHVTRPTADDPQAVRAIETNVRALGVGPRARIVREDVGRALDALAAAGQRFTIIFLDPPYDEPADPVLGRIACAGLLEPDGIVIAQHLTKRPPGAAFGPLGANRTRRFGETTLTFFRAQG
ncbi:MAG: RsmD family RNA methyltransferase [Candidatus Rokubacteria bacterium]|nr:RsmD family RNA methyltransferase [Candidatus Rokubacteria bacterium]